MANMSDTCTVINAQNIQKSFLVCVLKHTYMHGPRWQKDVDSGRRILLLYKFPSCDCCKGVEVFEMGWQLLICYQYKSTRTNNIKPLDQAKKVVQYSRGYHKTYCCNVETSKTRIRQGACVSRIGYVSDTDTRGIRPRYVSTPCPRIPV